MPLFLRVFLFAMAVLAAPPAQAQTPDQIDGVPVIERLEANALARGQVHRFYVRAGDQNTGQGWYVPVIAIAGARPGPRLMITAAIHGDELNGIGVIHKLAEEIDPKSLTGTLIMAPGLNTPGLIAHNRNMPYSDDGGGGINLNRVMPGDPASDDIGQNYAGRLWRSLLSGNADRVIDIHTQSRGTAYPMYVFVDPRSATARRMADLLAPDMIKLDPGLKGTLETAMNDAGAPAVTLELGKPKLFQADMIERGVKGVRNVMRDMGMLAGAQDLAGSQPFVGNQVVNIRAKRGGVATVLVKLGDPVSKGQTVAVVRDPLGRVRDTYVAPTDGRVASVGDDPMREPGSLLVRLLRMSTDPKCAGGC